LECSAAQGFFGPVPLPFSMGKNARARFRKRRAGKCQAASEIIDLYPITSNGQKVYVPAMEATAQCTLDLIEAYPEGVFGVALCGLLILALGKLNR
jgi:hypothetical protein